MRAPPLDCGFFVIVDPRDPAARRAVRRQWEEARRVAARIRAHSDRADERAYALAHPRLAKKIARPSDNR